MAIRKIPTTADIYLEVNGVRVAVVQSYKVTASRESKAIYAFGQSEPVSTIVEGVRIAAAYRRFRGYRQQFTVQNPGCNPYPADEDDGVGALPPADIGVIDRAGQNQMLGQDGQYRHDDEGRHQKGFQPGHVAPPRQTP